MDRENERRGQASEQEIRHVEAFPVPRRAAPAERENAVEPRDRFVLRAVAHCRHIRHEPDVPKHERDEQISADGENIPDERAAPLRPQPHRVGIRHQPIENPGPPEMQERE